VKITVFTKRLINIPKLSDAKVITTEALIEEEQNVNRRDKTHATIAEMTVNLLNVISLLLLPCSFIVLTVGLFPCKINVRIASRKPKRVDEIEITLSKKFASKINENRAVYFKERTQKVKPII